MRLAVLYIAVMISSACWLNREWDSCAIDSDCPGDQICHNNRGTHVCLPPELVDQGTSDASLDANESDVGDDLAEDLSRDVSDVEDLSDDPAAVPGAISYTVTRDGSAITTGVVDTSYDDTNASLGPPSANGFHLTATNETLSDTVRLSWSAPEIITLHEYGVLAVHTSGNSEPCASDTGYRSAPAITDYEMKVDGHDWTSVGLVTTYDHDDASAGTLDTGTVTATDGGSIYHVTLEISGISSALGDEHQYRVRALSSLGASEQSTQVTGRRGAPSTDIQWQRSASTSNTDHEDIAGATSSTFLDVDAPMDGSPRYYRCRVGDSDASATDIGWRDVLVLETSEGWGVAIEDDLLFAEGDDGDFQAYVLDEGIWTPDVEIRNARYPTGILALSQENLMHQFKGAADCEGGDPDCCNPWYQVVIRRFDSGSGNWEREYSSAQNCDSWYGSSVAIHGDWAVLGHPSYGFEASWRGTTTRLHYNELSGDWDYDGMYGVSPGVGYRFGASVSMAENLAVISAPGEGGGGYVYVFRHDSGSWALEQTLASSDRSAGDELGTSAAIGGARIILGAPDVDDPADSSGAAYVFRYEGGGQPWIEEGKLQTVHGSAGDEFGHSVALSGNQAVVGIPNDRAVSVSRYDTDSSQWYEYQYLQFPSESDFGRSVAISGPWIVVGSSSSGSTYAFFSDF